MPYPAWMTRLKEWFLERVFEPSLDFVRRWWHEATAPILWSEYEPIWKTISQRVLLWIPPVAFVVVLVGSVSLYFFIQWRATDLTAKALENVRGGNLSMAWLQIRSAEGMRSDLPEVQRAKILIQSRMDRPAALPMWEMLAMKGKLSAEEIKERARLAMLVGTDEQFLTAVTALEQSGDVINASGFRATRLIRKGDLSSSIEQARKAAASGEPSRQMDLLRVLLMSYGPVLKKRGGVMPGSADASREIIELVDQLQGTPLQDEAIAMALQDFIPPKDTAHAWGTAALQDLSLKNPALLRAAHVMIANRDGKPRDYYEKLLPVFETADAIQKARFAHWMSRYQMWDEILQLINPEEAERDPAAFQQRGQALAQKEQWQDLIFLTGVTPQNFSSLRLVLRGLALKRLKRLELARNAFADAVTAAGKDGTLDVTLRALDAMGEGVVADPILIKLCANPLTTDVAFRAARDRFSRQGKIASLTEAWIAALTTAPELPVVLDFKRRMALLEGRDVPLEETAAAVDAAPIDVLMRFTHALNLLKTGKAVEALGVFHDRDIMAEQLSPSDKVIAIAIFKANGMNTQADILRRTLHPNLLQKEEFALLMLY